MDFDRIIYLGSGSLEGLAKESQLKVLELTAGKIVTAFDSPLGFQHDPKSFVNEKSLDFLCLFLTIQYTRQYDLDMLNEMQQDNIASYICASRLMEKRITLGIGLHLVARHSLYQMLT
ncbi:hypothetical protein AAHB49_22720 [Bacillus cereus]